MGVVDPLGGPIRNEVHEAVVQKLKEYGRKYGSRLHVSVPGVPKGNVDLELFADNPAAVIKLLHTFNGPSPYLRDRDDPNEEERRSSLDGDAATRHALLDGRAPGSYSSDQRGCRSRSGRSAKHRTVCSIW